MVSCLDLLRPGLELEPAFAVVAENGKRTSATASDGKVLPSIAIEILPGPRRSKLTEAIGKEGLARDIIESGFDVAVRELCAHVFEQGRGLWRRRDGDIAPYLGFGDF